MDPRALYDRQAETPPGDVTNAYSAARDRFVIERLRRQRVPAGGGLRIAELSVGDAALSRLLASSLPEAALTLVDISPTRLERARVLIGNRPGVTYLTGNLDTEFDRLPSASFDAVIALDILEHVFDVFGFVAHCARIVAPGGQLMLRIPNAAYLRHRVNLVFGQLPVTASWFGVEGDLTAWRQAWGWDGGHLHLFTIPLVRRLLAEAGFKLWDCRDPGTRLEVLRNWWPSLLYANPLFIAQRDVAGPT